MQELERRTLGARLRELREYGGFSQEEVSAFLGIPRSAVSMIEGGLRKVDALELKSLADLYQTSLDELLGQEQGAQEKSIRVVARAAAKLSPEDQAEVVRFAEFLRQRAKSQQE